MRGCPCKDCSTRFEGCHSDGVCKAYTDWKKESDRQREEAAKQRSVSGAYYSFRLSCRESAIRARGERYR